MLYAHFVPSHPGVWHALSKAVELCTVAFSRGECTLKTPARLTHDQLETVHTFILDRDARDRERSRAA
jgi:hypothetical protein